MTSAAALVAAALIVWSILCPVIGRAAERHLAERRAGRAVSR